MAKSKSDDLMLFVKERMDDLESKIERRLAHFNGRLDIMERKIKDAGKSLSRVNTKLVNHINRPYSEIRVKESDGSWGDYTGQFYANKDDTEELLVERARTHFREYFTDSVHHRNKQLGIFLFSPVSGKYLVEMMETD